MKLRPDTNCLKTRRKLCLFACACVRDVWHLLQNWPKVQLAIDIVELVVDNEGPSEVGSEYHFETYYQRVEPYVCKPEGAVEAWRAAMAAITFLKGGWLWSADKASRHAVDAYVVSKLRWETMPGGPRKLKAGEWTAFKEGYKRHHEFLTDLVNTTELERLCVGGEQVKNAAKTIYDLRRWADMPVLADQLEEYGCTDERILQHLRSHGPHVKGCWVLDLILGKA